MLFFTFLCQQFIILVSYFVLYQLVITTILMLTLLTDIVCRIVLIGSCVKNLLTPPPDHVQVCIHNGDFQSHDSKQTLADDTAINSSSQDTSELVILYPQHYEEHEVRIKTSNSDSTLYCTNSNVEAFKSVYEESEDAPITNPTSCTE